LEAGRWAEAAAWLEVPEKAPETREPALLLRARVALAEGRPEAAVASLQGVRPDGPNSAEAAYLKGRVLQEVGNTPQAIAWFKTALAGRPHDPEILRRLSAAAYDLGDRETLMGALKTLTEVAPGDARAWRTLGLVTLEAPEGGERESDLAIQAYERSLQLDPGQPQARLELAEVLVRVGRFDEAERQLRDSERHIPRSEWSDLMSQIARGKGDLERCRALVEDGLKGAPNHPGLLARRGQLAQAEGRFPEAVEWYDRAIAAEPYDPQWYYMRGVALRKLGRGDEADRDAARAAELKRAVADMSRLNAEASDNPTDPDVRVRIGRLCESLGKPELAASWYRAALACDPRSAEALAALQPLLPRRDGPGP
jgi:superkiller protein 3